MKNLFKKIEKHQIFMNLKKDLNFALEIPKEKIKLDSSFKENLGLDDLDIAELVARTEENYNIRIPQNRIPLLITPKAYVAYVMKKR